MRTAHFCIVSLPFLHQKRAVLQPICSHNNKFNSRNWGHSAFKVEIVHIITKKWFTITFIHSFILLLMLINMAAANDLITDQHLCAASITVYVQISPFFCHASRKFVIWYKPLCSTWVPDALTIQDLQYSEPILDKILYASVFIKCSALRYAPTFTSRFMCSITCISVT